MSGALLPMTSRPTWQPGRLPHKKSSCDQTISCGAGVSPAGCVRAVMSVRGSPPKPRVTVLGITARAGNVCGKSEIRTRRRLLRRIRPHLKEETMSRPQATVRRVGQRPTANPKSEINLPDRSRPSPIPNTPSPPHRKTAISELPSQRTQLNSIQGVIHAPGKST